MKHLTTSTPAGRAERVRFWIRAGILGLDPKSRSLALSAGLTIDEIVSLGEERVAILEKRQVANARAQSALLNAKARSGRY